MLRVVVSDCAALTPWRSPAGRRAALLARNPDIKVDPILPSELFGQEDWLQSPGFLRTFPYQLDLGTPEWSGMDGFFAARLKRNK